MGHAAHCRCDGAAVQAVGCGLVRQWPVHCPHPLLWCFQHHADFSIHSDIRPAPSHGCATGMRKTTTRALGKLTSTPAPPPVLAPQREPAPPPPPQLTGRADAHRLHQRLAASHRPLRRLPWSSRRQRHNLVSLPQLRRFRHPATALGQAQGGRVRLRRHCRTSRGQ